MRKLLCVFLFFTLFVSCVFGQSPKYIFLFIGDGMGENHRELAEKVSIQAGLGELEMNHFPVKGRTFTASANSLITDSAAAATALACGAKTSNGMLGMTRDRKNVTSIAADAKNAGMKVGIITSVPVNHATPAGFYAHVSSRNMYDDIAHQMAESGFDFFGGAGIISKGDVLEFYELLNKKGYSVAIGLEDLQKISSTPAVALEHSGGGQMSKRYSNNDAAYKSGPGVMTLADLTGKAIKLLDNPRGFFIMVEGGAIDWAGHNNDLANCMWETIAMNDAVRVALDFYKIHPNETLIVVTADHETGGLNIKGNVNAESLLVMKSPDEVAAILQGAAGRKPDVDILAVLSEQFGLNDISEKDREIVLKCWNKNRIKGKESLTRDVMRLIYAKEGIKWVTGGHTGVPVTTTAIGPGSDAFSGKYQNTQIAETLRGYITQPAEKK